MLLSHVHSPGSPQHSSGLGKYWIKSLVSHEDKNILDEGGWLSDAHIQAAHPLLRKQYPHQNGLQSTLWLQFLLKWDSDPDDFVQIINISGQHWVCASNVNCPCSIVNVYDSIPSYSIGLQSLHLPSCKRKRTCSYSLCGCLASEWRFRLWFVCYC